MEPDLLNECFLAWLKRTGNAKVHGTTKRVPANVFEVEREHLRPILSTDQETCANSITRSIRKDNTIWFESNRYSLPLGTYNKERIANIRIVDDKLQIWHCFGDYMITEHPISKERGKLIKNRDHTRNKENSLNELQMKVLGLIDEKYLPYLLEIRKLKSRYYRDQLLLLNNLVKTYGKHRVEKALSHCMILELYSITDVKSTCEHFDDEESMLPVETLVWPEVTPINNPEMMGIVTQKRSLDEYLKAGGRCE
jgi:hypothetical protein